MRIFVAASAAILVAGCIHAVVPDPMVSGRVLEVSAVERLKPGESTVQDARALFGEPQTGMANGARGHCYAWYGRSSVAADAQDSTITLCFDAQGQYSPEAMMATKSK